MYELMKKSKSLKMIGSGMDSSKTINKAVPMSRLCTQELTDDVVRKGS